MNWLICFQTPYNSVKYQTSDINFATTLVYPKFLKYINSIFILDYNNFVDELNKFKTIFIDLDLHKWEIYKEKQKDTGFDELWELNREKEKLVTKNDRVKNIINNFDRSKLKILN